MKQLDLFSNRKEPPQKPLTYFRLSIHQKINIRANNSPFEMNYLRDGKREWKCPEAKGLGVINSYDLKLANQIGERYEQHYKANWTKSFRTLRWLESQKPEPQKKQLEIL